MRRPTGIPRRALAGLGLGVTLLVALPAAVAAHPLGNFTINHFAGLFVRSDGVLVDVVLDFAEIPAFQERQRIDADGNGTLSDVELAAERAAACPRLAGQLELDVAGSPVGLVPFAAGLSFPPGAGDLSTMRLVCEYEAALALPSPTGSISLSDTSYAERIGWREIVATADRLTLDGAIPGSSTSDRLTHYPKGLLAQPLDVRSASLTVRAGGPTARWDLPSDAMLLPGAALPGAVRVASAATAGTGTPPAPGVGARSVGSTPGIGTLAGAVPGGIGEDISGLVGVRDLTPFALIASLLVALGLGAVHALSPGHGKTVMAAYLVGSRGTARHAIALGLVVTVSHTLGVLVLAAVTLAASSVLPPERLYPILGLVSGGLVVSIGGWLLWARLRTWRSTGARHADGHEHAEAYVHADGHEHAEAHVHARGHGYGHEHGHEQGLAHRHTHDPGLDVGRQHRPDPAAGHSHGGPSHRHLPASGTSLSWRGLFSLGLAGGLVPSASALLLLLGSIAANRPAYGLALVVAFGAGMALVLGGIGFLLVRAGTLVERLPPAGRLVQLGGAVPVATALVVVAAGLYLTSQAVTQVF